MSKENFEKAFNGTFENIVNSIDRNRGEHVYFENNPADPTLPHTMHNINNAKLIEVKWLEHWFKSCVPEHTKDARQLTKEETEKIVNEAVPTSKNWSETHKQILCSFIPCPCCEKISFIVIVSAQGRFLRSEEDEKAVSGWYRVDISALKEGKFKVETHKISICEEAIFTNIYTV